MKEKCPCCKREYETIKDYMDYTLMSYDSNCKRCGWAEFFDTGRTEESFAGRWVVSSYYSDDCQTRNRTLKESKFRCKVWSKTWWILKPLFILWNKIEGKWIWFKVRYIW